MESLTIKLFAFKKSLLDALDQDYFTCACWKPLNLSVNAFFLWIKHHIVIVLASEYSLFSYLNVSSVIPRGKRHFYPANLDRFWENRNSLFIAEPRSDFNSCYEQRISENHNWILFIAVSLWFWSVAKYKGPIFKGFNSLHYWAGLNVLKVDCFWSCVPWTQATCLFCVPTIFVAYLDIITA